jgi:hypothetical protein
VYKIKDKLHLGVREQKGLYTNVQEELFRGAEHKTLTEN